MSTRIELLDLRAQAITAATNRRARGSHGLSSRRNWLVMAAPTITAASLRAARLDPAPGRRVEGDRVLTNDLFRIENGALARTGVRPRFADRLPEVALVSSWNGDGRR
jgi:hypothetical protein